RRNPYAPGSVPLQHEEGYQIPARHHPPAAGLRRGSLSQVHAADGIRSYQSRETAAGWDHDAPCSRAARSKGRFQIGCRRVGPSTERHRTGDHRTKNLTCRASILHKRRGREQANLLFLTCSSFLCR
ncbi:hypothetical protein FOZ62_015124, partial [Perkinsus olseni]